LLGVFLKEQVFTHGQLYIAFSRVTSENGLRITTHNNEGKTSNHAKNIVYKDVIGSLCWWCSSSTLLTIQAFRHTYCKNCLLFFVTFIQVYMPFFKFLDLSFIQSHYVFLYWIVVIYFFYCVWCCCKLYWREQSILPSYLL
jgi:hypothetical protein